MSMSIFVADDVPISGHILSALRCLTFIFTGNVSGGRKGGAQMANVLWTIIVILFVLWLIGLIAHVGGGLINILLVIAVIALIYNLVTGSRATAP